MTVCLPNFSITRPGRFSSWFVRQGAETFGAVAQHLGELPYRRLTNPSDLEGVLNQREGTFTVRHALLVLVAHEQGITDLGLALGVYEFDRKRWPKINRILASHQLAALPEVCGCMKYRGQLYSLEEPTRAKQHVLSEVEIAPAQIGNFKKRFHRNYLTNWMQLEKLDRAYTVDQLWQLRERCLDALAEHWNHRLTTSA